MSELVKIPFDRIGGYKRRLLSTSPEKLITTTISYLLWASLINLLITGFVIYSIYSVISVNKASTINLIRVDGVKVNETINVRRNVLLENTLLQANYSKGGK